MNEKNKCGKRTCPLAAEPAPGRPGLLALNPDERMKRHLLLPFPNRYTEELELIENKGRERPLIATKSNSKNGPDISSRLSFPLCPKAP